jgi:AcrR family transcriptional regulator
MRGNRRFVKQEVDSGNIPWHECLMDRPYHHGDLKQALVEAGIALLEEGGLQALTLRAAAARVGVSHAAPKNHFGSLNGLVTAIAAEGFRRHAAFMREGLPADAPPKARLHAAMRGYVRFATEHPHLFELMFSPSYPDFADPALQERAGASYAILREIAEGLDWDKGRTEDGQIKTEMMLWSLVHGYAILSLSGQFSRGADCGPVYGIDEVFPDFGYRD